jgi:hypothetical protein
MIPQKGELANLKISSEESDPGGQTFSYVDDLVSNYVFLSH